MYNEPDQAPPQGIKRPGKIKTSRAVYQDDPKTRRSISASKSRGTMRTNNGGNGGNGGGY
jgi:hypothetical protein